MNIARQLTGRLLQPIASSYLVTQKSTMGISSPVNYLARKRPFRELQLNGGYNSWHNNKRKGSSDRFTMAPFLAMAASLMAQPEPPTDDEEKDKEGSERSQEVETATDYSIRLDELKEAMQDLDHVLSLHSTDPHISPVLREAKSRRRNADHYLDSYSEIYSKPGITIWSRTLPSGISEYKVHGTFPDIPAIAFFYCQVALDDRMVWDVNTDEIRVLSTDRETDSELVYWRTCPPRPLHKREYIYSRRYIYDPELNMLALVSRSVPCPEFPCQHVQIDEYTSTMVVKPTGGSTPLDGGCEFILTYSEDGKSSLPNRILNSVAARTLPSFLETIRERARTLCHEEERSQRSRFLDLISRCTSHIRRAKSSSSLPSITNANAAPQNGIPIK